MLYIYLAIEEKNFNSYIELSHTHTCVISFSCTHVALISGVNIILRARYLLLCVCVSVYIQLSRYLYTYMYMYYRIAGYFRGGKFSRIGLI